MHQKSYIDEVLKHFGMEHSNTVDTPFDPHIRLCKEGKLHVRTGVSCATTQGESSVHLAATGVQNNIRKHNSLLGDEPKIPYRELIVCLL